MFCGKCGTQVEENDAFCPNCGAPIEKQINVQTLRTNQQQQQVQQPQPRQMNTNQMAGGIKTMLAKLDLNRILAVALLLISLLSFTKGWVGFQEYTETQIRAELGKVSQQDYMDAAEDLRQMFSGYYSSINLSEPASYKQVKVMMESLRDAKLTPGELVRMTDVISKWVSLVNSGVQAQVREFENNPSYSVDFAAADSIKTASLIVKIIYYVQMVIYYLTYVFAALGIWMLIKNKKNGALPYTICVCLLFVSWFAIIMYAKYGLNGMPSVVMQYMTALEEITFRIPAFICIIAAILSNVAMYKKINLNF